MTYAGCTFKGSYAQIDEVVAAVSAWIAENGYEPDDRGSLLLFLKNYFTTTEVMCGLAPLYQYRKPSISTV
mgnify:CR=1 FL=1